MYRPAIFIRRRSRRSGNLFVSLTSYSATCASRESTIFRGKLRTWISKRGSTARETTTNPCMSRNALYMPHNLKERADFSRFPRHTISHNNAVLARYLDSGIPPFLRVGSDPSGRPTVRLRDRRPSEDEAPRPTDSHESSDEIGLLEHEKRRRSAR